MMKTILIIGDSWGVPNWPGEHGYLPEHHTSLLLQEKGFKILNCARNAGGNIQSLSIAKEEVKEKVDYIIWFHTDFFRDTDPRLLENTSLDTMLKTEATRTYKLAADYFKSLGNPKLALIGGQAPILEEVAKWYLHADFYKQDWRSELLGRKLPQYYYLSSVDWVDKSGETFEEKDRLLEQHKEVLNAMIASDLFPDNAHPCTGPHADLTKELLETFLVS